MVTELTDRQRQVLDAIEEGARLNGRPPSIHELMRELDVASPNGIAKHLIALEAKGYIERGGGARGIRLLVGGGAGGSGIALEESPPNADRLAYVPLVGDIAAGSPILAQENVEEVLPVPESMVDGGETFFLRVKGDSMIEEGIMPGDLVMVGKCDSVSNGELAAVMLEDEATVKRFYRRGGRIVLEPANPRYEPIVVDPSVTRCAVIGKITGLLRSYRRKF